MRFFVRSLIVFLTLANLPLSMRLCAQTGSGVIMGTIVDSVGGSLIGARVMVQPGGREVATDNQGQFCI